MPPAPSPTTIRLSLAAVLVSDLGVGLLFGFQPPLVAFVLERSGTSGFGIGLVNSIGTLAIIALGPVYPVIMKRLGMRASLVGGLLLAIALLVTMPMVTGLAAWVICRFVGGVALGLSWIASEVWLNRLATDRNRGSVMALYATVFALGVAAGPVLLQWTGTEGFLPFGAGAIGLGLSTLPLMLTRHVPDHELEHQRPRSLFGLMRVAPVVMLAGLTAGLVESADLSLLPLFGIRHALDEHGSLVLVSVFLIGNVILQMPIGGLADRLGRRGVLGACAIVSAIGPLLLPTLLPYPVLLWPLLFVWGGTMYGFYTQGIALVGEIYPVHELAAANTAFVMVYCTGGLIGPSVGGLAMDLWPTNGFIMLVSSAALLLALVIVCDSLRRRRSPVAQA